MKIVVQKFGGTSVARQERREAAVNKIENCINEGYFPVVVVSAIGRNGDAYATDTLINFSMTAGGRSGARELDLLMSCGEIISSVVLSNTIKARGLESVVLTGGQAGIITDDSFGDASILRVDDQNIQSYIEKGIIPVVAGFQGMTENGEITTLGRGGSDITAAILGEALKAHSVEIYTDVDGVMAVDPKLVPSAKAMDKVHYDEVYRMAEYGAKVLHKRAVQIAMRSNIPMLVKNTMSDSRGTTILGTKGLCECEGIYKDKPVTAIAQASNKALVILEKLKAPYCAEDDEALFSSIYERSIDMSMISIYPWRKSFVIDDSNVEAVGSILEEKAVGYEIQKNCSRITLIGSGMKGMPGVVAKLTRALSKYSIPILQTADSHTAISCLVNGEHEKTAVNALYDEFEL